MTNLIHTRAALRRAVPGLAMLSLAVLVLLIAAYGVWNTSREPRTTPLARPSASMASESAYGWAPVGDTTLIIGDSYGVGTGAAKPSERWTTIVAEEMGWVEVNRALGGTGYYSTSGDEGCGRAVCPFYRDTIVDVAREVDPEVVIISGGQNDLSNYLEDPDGVKLVIQDTYRQAAKTFPEAQIIAVGPSVPSGTDDTAVRMDASVRQAADEVGAKYVSLLDPPVITPDMVLADGGHVGSEGHAAIAERVISTLRSSS